ncbi:MAG: hypothetical protein GQ569_08845, partial [Methylococcaceae bacterium]|nr:hypothetical protein [Methylococcaceae bacterium]
MATDKSDYQRSFSTVFTKAEELLTNAGKSDNALSQYLDSWLEIAEISAELNNFALQDVVLLFIETSNEAFSSLKLLTDEHWQLLKKWDTRFENYIKAPDNHHAATSLVKCLSEPLLGAQLSPADEKMLLGGFTLVSKQLRNSARQVTEEKQAIKPSSSWDEVSLLFNKAILNLQDVFAQKIIHDKQLFEESLELYLQDWQKIADLIESKAEQQPWMGLLDVVLLFVDINTEAFNQDKALSDEQQGILNKWHNLFSSYIKTQGSRQISVALIKCLTHQAWSGAISTDDEKMLLENIDSPEPQAVTNVPAIEKTAEVETSDPIKQLSIWQQLEPFVKVIRANLKNVIAGDKQALALFHENWQKIFHIVEENDEHQGLLDVILIFIEISSAALEQADALDDKQIISLNKWHQLFSSYLTARGNRTLAMSLVKCLGDAAWVGAITTEDEKMLLKGFDEKPKATTQSPHTSSNEPVSKLEAKPSQNLEELPLEVAETNTKPLSILEELEQQLQKSSQHLKAAIDQQISGNLQVFSENLQLYREDWQQIVAIMDKDSQQLAALMDVVLLFNEISGSAFDAQNDLSSVQVGLLNKWQNLFSQHLENTTNPQIIKSLVECLESSVWPEAIFSEDSELLFAAFPTPEEQQSPADISLTAEDAVLPISEFKAVNIWEQITSIFQQTATELNAILDFQIDNNSKALDRSVQVYIKYWQQIADILEENKKQSGLLDVVLLFTEVSIPAFEELNSQQLTVLNQWHHLFNDYVKAQGHREVAKSLVDCLVNPAWPEALSQEDGKMLLEGFITDDDNRLTIVESNEPLINNVDIVDEYHPVWEKIKLPVNDAFAQINTIDGAINLKNLPLSFKSLQQYAGYWSLIVEMINDEDKSELQSLADVSLLFSDNCLELIEQQRTLNNEFISLLQQWHTSFKSYLQDITESPTFISLISLLEHQLWVRPLTAEDRGMLVELASDEDESLIFTDDDSEDLLAFNEELFADDSINEENESQELFAEESINVEDDSQELFAEDSISEADDSQELFAEESINVEDDSQDLFAEDSINEEDDSQELLVEDSNYVEYESHDVFAEDSISV